MSVEETKRVWSTTRNNIAAASFSPASPELLRLRLALRGNQEDTNRFIMALEGLISHQEFFNPENLQRILADTTAGCPPAMLPDRPRHGT